MITAILIGLLVGMSFAFIRVQRELRKKTLETRLFEGKVSELSKKLAKNDEIVDKFYEMLKCAKSSNFDIVLTRKENKDNALSVLVVDNNSEQVLADSRIMLEIIDDTDKVKRLSAKGLINAVSHVVRATAEYKIKEATQLKAGKHLS